MIFPSPRNPSLPGFRLILRKSGKPDLRWGGVRGGGRARRSDGVPRTTPSLTLPHKGGGNTLEQARMEWACASRWRMKTR